MRSPPGLEDLGVDVAVEKNEETDGDKASREKTEP